MGTRDNGVSNIVIWEFPGKNATVDMRYGNYEELVRHGIWAMGYGSY